MNTQVEVFTSGKPVKQYLHNGKTYIEAKIGSEYSIKIRNSGSGRKLAIVTVDGLNVISGNPHSSENEQGYIVNGYDSIEIKGFRKDMSSVGAFKFCQAGHSYCNEKGLKGNNGVIGVRIYDESIKLGPISFPFSPPIEEPWKPIIYPLYQPIWIVETSPSTIDNGYIRCESTTSYKADFGTIECSHLSNSSSPSFDAGTTWGKSINDSISYSNFERSSSYEDVVIYYDVRKNLEKIGIKFNKEKQVWYPQAFNSFAKPPKGWNG